MVLDIFKELKRKLKSAQKLNLTAQKQEDIYEDDPARYENELELLRNADSFTIPDESKIKSYINAFSKILKAENTSLINKMFKIVKFIGKDSANGSVYVIKLNKSKSPFSKLLIKYAKNVKTADPISYEYYVGLTLNQLRPLNIQNFSLVYGRLPCGIDLSDLKLDDRLMCDKSKPNGTYILYEYITTQSDKSMTLDKYVSNLKDITDEDQAKKIYSNLKNILIMLMISLQHAQDILDFTHYDLHLNNVLIVKLNATYKFEYQYGNQVYEIILDYFPFIIDYGRSHVNPEKLDKDIKIYDTDKIAYYDNFAKYQMEIWKNESFNMNIRSKEEGMDKMIWDWIQQYVQKILESDQRKKDILKYLRKNYENYKYIQLDDINVQLMLSVFYLDEEFNLSHNIRPEKFNRTYDLYRFTRSLCDMILEYDKSADFWKMLNKELMAAYPYFIPVYFVLPKEYESFTGEFRKPIDVANYFYELTSEQIRKFEKESKKLRYDQIGKGKKNMLKQIEQLSKKQAKDIRDKDYKITKKKQKKRSDDYIIWDV